MSGVRAFLVVFALTLSVDIKSESVCEEKYSKKQFVITSKNYPEAYPANFTCRYLIYGDVCPRKYNFQFLDFDLEADEQCSKDYLKVGEQRLCGSKSGVKTYSAPEGSLVLNFVTDANVSGKGFRLLVTRLPCETAQEKQNFYNFFDWKQAFGWNYRPVPQTTTFCCKQAHNAKHFFLASPGFPYSHKHPNDCLYHIYKAKQNICRLRIHVVYFLHGETDETCSKGFLEIDGKRLCGCQNDLKLIVPFDPYSNFPKVLRLKNDGSHKSEYSGFALEVFQDECPWKYSSSPRLQKRESPIQNAKLLFENSQHDLQQQVVKHVYFFSDPQEVNYEDYYPDVAKPKDREEADYVDTSDLNFHLNGNEAGKCAAFDFGQLARNELWVKTSQCETSEREPRDCKELSAVRGYFYSPGYPYYYPPNLNLCYRFKKQAGYCGVKLVLVDFQIEYSRDCRKDYLLLGGKFRYCGQQLHNTVSTLDLSKQDFEDVIFMTDTYYCDRGFKAVYEQIPCMHEHATTLAPPVTPAPILPCNSMINEDDFTLNIFASHQDTCIFTIYKSNSEVCRLELQKLVQNLDCNSEDVFIKGRSLCSLTESDNFSVDFKNDDSIPIVYKRFITHPGITGLRVQLSGKQSSENCFYNIPEVPAEKLATASSDYGLFLVLNSAVEDLCGVISNATFAESPQDSCRMLKETNMVKTCIPARTNATELPSDVEQLKMFLSSESKEVTVKKVDCSYLTA